LANFKLQQIKISGIAASAPKNKESNWDYNFSSDAEKKLLIKTTGIETRRVIKNNITTSDLCFEAAQRLMTDLAWEKGDIQIIVFLSQSRDYYLPATAVELQDRLGLSQNCIAFDISLGCSGFPYGLSIISSMMSASGIKKGLLLMGDVSSLNCNKEDKSTYPLFGDAGTATALELDNKAPEINFSLNSDGSRHQAIIIPDGGMRSPITPDSFIMEEFEGGIKRHKVNVVLEGLDVFNFSIKDVPDSVKDFLAFSKTDIDYYDYFVMHQANRLMNESIRKKLKFTEQQTPYSLRNFGNTSSASIPLTIVTQLNNQVKNNALNILATGFGVGLSWGSCNINLDHIICPELIEI